MTSNDLPIWQQGVDGTWFQHTSAGWVPSKQRPSQSPDGTWWVSDANGSFSRVQVRDPSPTSTASVANGAPGPSSLPEHAVPAGWTTVPSNDANHRRSVGPLQRNSNGTYSIAMMCSCGWRATGQGSTEKECRASAYEASEDHQAEIRGQAGIGSPEARVVFWISAFFGVFGIIPAAVYANAATRDQRPSAAYWRAFLNGFLLSIFIWIVLISVATRH